MAVRHEFHGQDARDTEFLRFPSHFHVLAAGSGSACSRGVLPAPVAIIDLRPMYVVFVGTQRIGFWDKHRCVGTRSIPPTLAVAFADPFKKDALHT